MKFPSALAGLMLVVVSGCGTVSGPAGTGNDALSPVTALVAVPLNKKIALEWSNPTFTGFAGVTIVRKAQTAPSSPTDGMVIYQGSERTHIDAGLVNATTYFYAVFATDGLGHVSAPVTTASTPLPSGSLDPTFNHGSGFAVHRGAGSGNSYARAVVFDSQDRIVVTGSTNNGVDDDMAVWRFLPDGTPDQSLGGTGFVSHGNAAGGNADDRGMALAIDSQGRIVVAGASRMPGMPSVTAAIVWAYRSDGTLDPSFGGTGYITRHGTGTTGDSFASGLQIVTGDKILFGGQSFNTTTFYDASLWQILPNGNPDPNFGAAGTWTDDMGLANGSSNLSAITLVLDPATTTTKVVAAGSSGSRGDVFIRRYDLQGFPDQSFGADNDASGHPDSWAFRDVFSDYDSASAMAADAAHNLFVVGISYNTTGNDLMVWRVAPNGAGAGIVATRNAATGSTDQGAGIAVTPEGIVVVGTTTSNANRTARVEVWRLDATTLMTDNSFAQSGVMTTGGAAGGADDEAAAVAVDRFGRLVIVGSSSNTSVAELAVWRVIP